jgi:hypothetical protein
MSKTLDTTCGIYFTEYTLTRHRNGSCTVKAPFLKWSDTNSGALAFRKIKIEPAQKTDVVWFFVNGETYSDITGLTLSDTIQHLFCNH